MLKYLVCMHVYIYVCVGWGGGDVNVLTTKSTGHPSRRNLGSLMLEVFTINIRRQYPAEIQNVGRLATDGHV